MARSSYDNGPHRVILARSAKRVHQFVGQLDRECVQPRGPQQGQRTDAFVQIAFYGRVRHGSLG